MAQSTIDSTSVFSINKFNIERASFGFFEGVDGSITRVSEGTEGAILDRAYLCDEVWVRFELTCLKDSIEGFTIELSKLTQEQAGRFKLPDFLGMSINGSFTACSINEQKNPLDFYNKSSYNTFDCLNGNGLQLMKGDKINVEFISWFDPVLNLVSPADWQVERLGLKILYDTIKTNAETEILIKSPVFRFEDFGDEDCNNGCGKILSIEGFDPLDFGDERRIEFPQIDWIEFTESLPLSWQEYELRGIFDRDHNFYDLPNQGFVVEYDVDDIWYWDGKSILGSIWIKHKGSNTLKTNKIKISGSFELVENNPILYCQKAEKIECSLKGVKPKLPIIELQNSAIEGTFISQKNQLVRGCIKNNNEQEIKPFSLYINAPNCKLTQFKFGNIESPIFHINDGWMLVNCPLIANKDSLDLSFNATLLGVESTTLNWLFFTDEITPISLLKPLGSLTMEERNLPFMQVDSLIYVNPEIDIKLSENTERRFLSVKALKSPLYRGEIFFKQLVDELPANIEFDIVFNDSLWVSINIVELNIKQFENEGKQLVIELEEYIDLIKENGLVPNDELVISWEKSAAKNNFIYVESTFKAGNYTVISAKQK